MVYCAERLALQCFSLYWYVQRRLDIIMYINRLGITKLAHSCLPMTMTYRVMKLRTSGFSCGVLVVGTFWITDS